MKDYSFSTAKSRIIQPKTREYFEEVLNSYYNGNYRSAIVILYSVLISDIIAKLKFLSEVYADETAGRILNDIREKQQRNPYNPDWEQELIETVKRSTALIGEIEYVHISALRKYRNLCAHPSIINEESLYNPNSEITAGCIRNILDSIFVRSALLSKKVLKSLLVDIAEQKELLEENELKRYVQTKYLDRLNAATEINIFRDLWKLVFRTINAECDENRKINFMVLKSLYTRNPEGCLKKIKEEPDYFSSISKSLLSFVIVFLAEFDHIFSELNTELSILIRKKTQTNNTEKLIAWFLADSFENHLKNLIDLEKGIDIHELPLYRVLEAIDKLLSIATLRGYDREVFDYVILRYSNCGNYDEADLVFTFLLKSRVQTLPGKKLIELCEKTNQNSQTCGRKRAKEDHGLLLATCKNVIGEDFREDFYQNTFAYQE